MERLFWTPAIIDDLPDAARLAEDLEPLILERRKAKPTVQRSHVGAWHSDYRLLDWGGKAARRICDHVIALANAHSRDIRETADSPPQWVPAGWANVFDAGDYSVPHAHGGAYWSAVYYLRADQGSGGELLIHDPRRPAIEMHAPHLRFDPSGGEMIVNLAPRAGMLVLMPSWLVHSVARWDGPGLRISIAINLTAPSPVESPVDEPSFNA